MNCHSSSRSRDTGAIHRDADAIAIVSAACRYPGGCEGADAFWELLKRGETGFRAAPAGRWPGWDRVAGFLDAPFPHAFEAAFFDVAPAEAIALDPQQRLLLEVGWRALEGAGIAITPQTGRPIGVFVAISTGDYQRARLWGAEPAGVDSFTATGVSFAAAAGRLSYCFGFDGPSLAVDTACSSSLVALHLARQAIRNGECEAALVAGVNALLAPHLFACLDTMNLLSPDGVCRAFDEGANGYVRAEGCGAIVVKPLAAALRDGNEILALIRGSAVNQDGRSASLTAPSGAAQRGVIDKALAAAGLQPTDIDYVEAHGTGTPLGDAIELNALAGIYAQGREASAPLLVGSAKANIGHLEAGAGLAGLIKTVMSLRHGLIPGHPRLARPTSHLAWEDVALRVPTTCTGWPETGRPRRAGVSSFGFSGTNAHVILEQAPEPRPRAERRQQAVVLPVSARSPAALDEMCRSLADWLEAAPRDLGDVAYTLAVGRTPFAYRRAVVGDRAATLARALRGEATEAAQGRLHDLAAAWEVGAEVDWARLYGRGEARFVGLPGHPLYPLPYWPAPVAAPASPAPLPGRIEDWRALLDRQARAGLGDVRPEPLDPDGALTDQGFTSLLGLELRRALEGALGRSLPVSLLYDYPTLNRMAAWLAGSASPETAAPCRTAPSPTADPDFDFLDTLSAAELAELIEREVEP